MTEWALPQAPKSIASTARLIARTASRQSRSLRNRLHSIAADAHFVSDTAAQLGLPLVANERCGRWYVPVGLGDEDSGERECASAYFKSTDGHYGTWAFSLRRLNLGVLECVGDAVGCIIVDSTRRGKHMPDALSKTIPIWCAVMNRLLFPSVKTSHRLVRLSQIVSLSEYEQIEGRIDDFVAQAEQNLELDLDALRERVKKPMHPIWLARSLSLTASSVTLPDEAKSGQFNPVYLCMASVFQPDANSSPGTRFEYVQGAGDDAESWAQGLNPMIFWQHQQQLLAANEDELPDLITTLLSAVHSKKSPTSHGLIVPGASIIVADIGHGMKIFGSNDLAIFSSPTPPVMAEAPKVTRLLHLKCGVGKLGSRDLRKELPKVPNFIAGKKFEKIIVCCDDNKDIAIGIVLVILVLFSLEDERTPDAVVRKLLSRAEAGTVSSILNQEISVDKILIRKRLSRIIGSIPSASPSRATLNAVNSFLMKEPS